MIIRQHLYSGLINTIRHALLQPDALDGSSGNYSIIDACGQIVEAQLSAVINTSDATICPFVLRKCVSNADGELVEPLPDLIHLAFDALLLIESAQRISTLEKPVEFKSWSASKAVLQQLTLHIW